MLPPPIPESVRLLLKGEVSAWNTDDWEFIVRHGLAGRVYHAVHRQARAFDPVWRDKLTAELRASAAKNLALLAEFQNLNTACRKAAIDCIPLRGFVTVSTLQGSIAERPMGDLDMLFRREQAGELVAAFEKLGYELMDRRRGFAERFAHELKFVKLLAGHYLVIEPRWSIVYPPQIIAFQMAGVWQRLQTLRIAAVETRRLSNEDMLLNLCVHLAHHGKQSRWLWWFELDEFLRRDPELDPKAFGAIAKAAHCELLVSSVLNALQTELHTLLPASLFRNLSSDRKPTHAEAVAANSNIPGRESLATWMAQQRFRDRWDYAFQLLFPSRRFLELQSGKHSLSAIYLHGFQRFVRLGVRSVRILWPQTNADRGWDVESVPQAMRFKYNSPSEIESAVRNIEVGLYDEECKILDSFMPPVGRVLVVGCGAGRECVALAERGYEVTGIDTAEHVIAASKRIAKERGLKIEYRCLPAHELDAQAGKFDAVWAHNSFLSLVPGRTLRNKTLIALAGRLKDDGKLFIGASLQRDLRFRWQTAIVNTWRTLCCRCFNQRLPEPGDRWQTLASPGGNRFPIFIHSFGKGRYSLEAELSESGLDFEPLGNGVWVCRRIRD